MPPSHAELRAQVERTTTIATVPHIVASLRALMDAPSPSTLDIAEEIGKDQVLTAKVLKVVNSGFCGFNRPVTTIRHALVLLGLDVVRTLVVGSSIIDVFAERSGMLEGLWEHSLATARASNDLAAAARIEKPEEVAVAGLLHDFGKLLIAECFPDAYLEIRHMVQAHDCLQIEAEREVLGVTHGEVGMWLLKKWSLPGKLVYPVAYHNNFHPVREFADRTAVVHLADILVRAKGIGNAGDKQIPALDPEAWKILDITMDDVAHVSRLLDAESAAAFA
jgi:putative nucleotidyltransferase with HDIG domain